VTDIELIDKDETQVTSNAIHLNCPETYEGMGVRFNPQGKIIQVAKGWPAHKAGIQVGDYLIAPYLVSPYNGFIEFDIERNGKRVHMKLRTEHICSRDKPFK